MKDLRQIIAQTLNETFIQELAKSFMDFGPNVGLITTIPSSGRLSINFFDFIEKKCVGVITLKNEGDIWYVTTVSADDGFGPIIYKSGMMAVYPDKICPTRMDTPSKEAINIWYKFFLNSSEVKKEAIKTDSKLYKNYMNDDLNIILNYAYSRPKSTWFNKMLKRGEELSIKHEISAHMISKICSDYFVNKYKER